MLHIALDSILNGNYNFKKVTLKSHFAITEPKTLKSIQKLKQKKTKMAAILV